MQPGSFQTIVITMFSERFLGEVGPYADLTGLTDVRQLGRRSQTTRGDFTGQTGVHQLGRGSHAIMSSRVTNSSLMEKLLRSMPGASH